MSETSGKNTCSRSLTCGKLPVGRDRASKFRFRSKTSHRSLITASDPVRRSIRRRRQSSRKTNER